MPDAPLCRLALHLFTTIGSWRRQKTVQEALANRSRIRDIQGALTAAVLCDYNSVWRLVAIVALDDLTSDRFMWCQTVDGTYSAFSTYRAFFIGMATLHGVKEP